MFPWLSCAAVVIHLKNTNKKNASQNNQPTKEIDVKQIPLKEFMSDGDLKMPAKEEFQELHTKEQRRDQNFTDSQGRRYNSRKNGALNSNPLSIPWDHNRVVLKNPVGGVDYVNASWISKVDDAQDYEEAQMNNYLPFSKISFIVAQTPMEHTKQHHFQLLHEEL